MVALIGPFGAFHLTQKRVHFVQRQTAIGTNRAVARHGGQKFVALFGQSRRAACQSQVAQDGARERFYVTPGEQGRNGTYCECSRSRRAEREPQILQGRSVFFDQGDIALVYVKHHRYQQLLPGNLVLGKGTFQPLVDDAFVRCMHVDQYQPVAVLSQYVDAVQLPQCHAQRQVLAFGR